MQKQYRILVIGFLLVVLIAGLPSQVSADSDDDERISIIVENANYQDCDNDNHDDDVLTVFRVIPPDDDWDEGILCITCTIEKPSGSSIETNFEVFTEDSVVITIVWFNWADESGDYILRIRVEANSYDDDDDEISPAYIEHVFDPPGGSDPGPPVIAIMSIDEMR